MKKSLVFVASVVLVTGCATKSINEVEKASTKSTLEQKVVQQEVTINKLNNQMELMGKNLIFLNKKVKSQEDMLNGTTQAQATTVQVLPEEIASAVGTTSAPMVNIDSLVKFKPTTFTIVATTPIYNANGEEVNSWNVGKRFTSYLKSDNFYKVSGYSAAGRRWAKTNQDLYVPIENTQQAR